MDAFEFITGGDANSIIDVLSRARCGKCGGSGERNDAEPGDIGFNTWVCKSCDGKGWDRQAVAEIIESVE